MKTLNDMEILIIGAGIAGLTAAALLNKEGVNVTLIEKVSQETYNTTGYMIGLLPLGGRVLNALGLQSAYYEASVEMQSYSIHKENGETIQTYPLDFIHQEFGSYRGISRVELIELLLSRINTSSILYNQTVDALKQQDKKINITFSNGKQRSFDLVIGADGMHSLTRKQILKPDEYTYYETGWGGWIGWIEGKSESNYHDYWGSSLFMGLYPVKNKTGIFIGSSKSECDTKGLQGLIKEARQQLTNPSPLLLEALEKLSHEKEPYFLDFHDCHTRQWYRGNVVLLGDASAGFLPTAGIGASMAMDSAAALVDELSRSDSDHLEYALKLYTKRQQHRVEIAQSDSRDLGKMMFIRSSLLSSVRNYALRFYTLKSLLSDIANVLEGD